MNELGNTPADKNYKPSGISRAEERALEAFPMKDYNKEPNRVYSLDSKSLDEIYREVFVIGYEQALKDIGIVNELTAQQGIAVVEHLENHAGYQLINTLRFVGEDEDKPRPMPCRYYHV